MNKSRLLLLIGFPLKLGEVLYLMAWDAFPELLLYEFSFEDLIEDLNWIYNLLQKDCGLRIFNHFRKNLDFWIFLILLRIFFKL